MYTPYIVKRTQIYLDAAQADLLARRAEGSRVTSSRLIREAIEAYLTGPDDDETELARQRQAIDEAFGSIPRLPVGDDFLREARRDDDRRAERLDSRWRSL